MFSNTINIRIVNHDIVTRISFYFCIIIHFPSFRSFFAIWASFLADILTLSMTSHLSTSLPAGRPRVSVVWISESMNFITYIPPVKPDGQTQGCILRRSMVINSLGNDSPVRM